MRSDSFHELGVIRSVFFIFCLLMCDFSFAETPCTALRGSLDSAQLGLLEKNIVRQRSLQLDVKKVDVLAFFTYQGWSIVYENDGVSDESLLIYNDDIFNTDYVVQFSGAVSIDDNMTQWIKQEAPDIPEKVAQCFSWYSTYRKD